MTDANIVIGIEGRTDGARKIKRSLDDVSDSGDKARKSTNLLTKALVALGGTTAALAFLKKAQTSALNFSSAMAEVSTLVNDANGEMQKLSATAKQQAIIFGSQPVEQSKALYQIISAGAQNAAQATETLTAANKLAVGGVTDVATAADGLTSVLNAYGDKVESATAASDSLFVAMRAGKTTIGELSSGLGKVAPLAATVGVEFDELTASVAALTKGGISTQESITGVRAILASVAKPTSEARDLAAELGINFSAAGLEAQGFAGFLEELTTKTGGSTELLAQLFGGVEALVPILALSGEAGESFADILADMGDKAGQTDVAFNKISETAEFRLNQSMAKLEDKLIDIGQETLQTTIPAIELLTDNLDEIATTAQIAAGALLAIGARSVIVAFASATAAAGGLTAAMVALNATLLGPAAFIGILGAAGAAAFIFRDEITASIIFVMERLSSLIDEVTTKFSNFITKTKAGGSALFEAGKNILGLTSDEELQRRLLQLADEQDRRIGNNNAGLRNRGLARQEVLDLALEELAGIERDIPSRLGASRPVFGPVQPTPAKPSLETEIKTSTGEIGKLNKELKKTGDTIKDDIRDPFKDFTNDIERDFARAFKDAFADAGGGFKRLMSGLKASFTDFLGEIAFQASVRPILVGIGAVGGTAGGAGIANAATGGGIGGGGGLSSLFSGGGNLLSGLRGGLNTPAFGAGSFIGKGINSIGSALGLNNASFVGPLAPGTSSLASAFTPAAGIAGFGGNLLANAIFGGDRGIGATIGGVAGGVGGTAIGASIGAVGGPIGALAGAFLGNALGGLFGGSKPSQKSQFAEVNLSNLKTRETGFKGKKFSQENRDFADGLIDQAGELARLLQSAGADLSGKIGVTIRSRKGQLVGGGGFENGQNFGNNAQGVIQAVTDRVLAGVTSAPDDLTSVLENVKGADAKSIAEAIGILELVRSFEKAAEVSRPLKDALDALDDQFGNLRDKAVDLGLPVDKLTESYEKQKNTLIRDTLRPLQDFLDQQPFSQNSSLSPTRRLSLSRSRFDENLANIRAGDLSGLGNITGQASQLLNAGRDVFASGEGFSTLERFVRQSVAGISDDLGAPGGLDANISQNIVTTNAEQTSILKQVNAQLEELRVENRKLRKSMERVGNAVNV